MAIYLRILEILAGFIDLEYKVLSNNTDEILNTNVPPVLSRRPRGFIGLV